MLLTTRPKQAGRISSSPIISLLAAPLGYWPLLERRAIEDQSFPSSADCRPWYHWSDLTAEPVIS
jgi:hypothetical protein